MRFRDVLYLVNASLRCLLHIEANIFMRDSFSCYSGSAGVLFNASSEHSEIFISVFPKIRKQSQWQSQLQ